MPGFRRFLLGIVPCALGGCVLPLAPEFQEEQNLPPVVVDVSPPEGITVLDPDAVFEALVQDPNENDTLYARWLIDYPPYDPAISRLSELSPLPNAERIAFRPDCIFNAISPTVTGYHRLMLVVSDRPFIRRQGDQAPSDNVFDETPADANVIRLTWYFQKTCL